MPNCILTPLTDESVITYTQLSGVQGVDIQSHVIDDVMRQLSFDETELDGEAGFADVAGSGVDSSGLSHDESFGVDDLDLNLNEPVNLNVSQVETQSELPVSEEQSELPVFEEPDVGRTEEPILAEVSTQEPIVAEVSTEVPIVEEVGTQEFSVEDVVLEDYVSSREDAEQGNGQEDESAPTDGQFFYDDEGIDTASETKYDVQYSKDEGTYDDDVDEDFLVDEENEIVEPDVDVHLFGISMDLPFYNLGITNLVSDDVLEGEGVDVINADGFDSDSVVSGSTHFTMARNLLLQKRLRIRARCDGKVHVFTMSQGTVPTGLNHGMEAGPSGSSGPTTRSKKRKNTCTNDDSQASPFLDAHDKGDLCPWVLAKAKAKRDIRGDHVLQYSMLRDYVVELQSKNPNTTIKIAVERNTNPSLPTMVFQRIYICLRALKRGIRACKRDLLGLDGAFIKGPFLGQVLVAVGLDSNNGIYPLAYALVEAESK
ncbi:hypothetical protein Tco_1061645, partial [Tanacetum coccineum]